MFGVPSGVTLKLKLIRSSQTYIFPIHLSEEVIPAAIFYATVTPLIAYFVIKKTIIDPMNEEQKQRNIDKAKETNKARIAEKRKEAESAVSLMSATYERVKNDEEKKKGLVIIKAFYGKSEEITSGDFENNDEWNSEPVVIEVSIPLQCLIRDSRLVLHKFSKVSLSNLIFYLIKN